MARKDEGDIQFNPRHRIVGAIILVSLAVIFVPMILNKHEPPSGMKQDAEIIPPRAAEDGTPDTKVLVTPVNNEPMTAPKPQPAPATASPETHPTAGSKPAPAGAQAPTAGPEATPKAEPNASSARPASRAKPKRGWVVQVGTFTNPDNARRLSQNLKGHGHDVHEEAITLNGRKAVRLRVGPFADKAMAARVQARIRKETGVQGVVLAYP